MSEQTPTNLEPLAVDIRGLQQLTGLSQRTLWSKTKDGTIPHVKIGARVIYPLHEIREWLTDESRKAARNV